MMTDTEMFPNPIGFLNEFCQKTVTPYPIYNVSNKEGPTHSPMFNVECLFKGTSFEGRGLTIKKAKDNAAREAIKTLKLLEENKQEKNKPSFKLVEISDLESFWDGAESNIKIMIRKKEGDSQTFKTFLLSKNQAFGLDP